MQYEERYVNVDVATMERMRMQADLINGAAAAAAYTGLPRRVIYRLAEQGEVPVVRKGRRLYFRKSELEQAFQAKDPKSPVCKHD